MGSPPEIKVKLTAEDTGVSAAIRELSSQLKNLKKQEDETATSGLSLSKAFSGIAAAAATIGLARIGKEAFDSAVNIGKMSDKTGISTQTLSVFHKVAGDVGVQTEAVDRGLTRAAKSITEFEMGTGKAGKAFAILGLTQKDFAGLKTDEKIKLVTQRIGEMQAGFRKATATQLIFSKGGAEMIPVMNALAAQGFDKATEATSKLGLLLDQSTADSFREAKASIQELTDVGAGMATQFEAGMLPAISDVGEAFADSLTQGGVSFKDLGKYAGDAVRGISLAFLVLGQTLGTVAESIADVFSAAWKYVKNTAETDFTALGQAARGHLGQAFDTLSRGEKENTNIVSDEIERQKAMYKSLADTVKEDASNLFPSAEEEARRKKARLARLRPEKETEAPEVSGLVGKSDAAEKAAFALLERQLQDELAIHRAYAKQQEEIEKEFYAKGELTLAEYYDQRRAAVAADSNEEIAILKRGIEGAKAEADKASAAKGKATTPAETDKAEAERLRAMMKIEELQTKITEIEVNSSTKIHGLNTEEFKAKQENQTKILEFERLIDKTKGDSLAAALHEIEIEKEKLRVILEQSGASKEQIDAELASYTQIKTAQATFDANQKDAGERIKILGDERAAIEDKVKNGKLFQAQADEQIRQLEAARLPVLQQIAAQLLAQAKATGDEEKIAKAEDFQKQVNQIAVQANTAGQQVAQIRAGLQSSLTGGIENFFNILMEGTRSVGQAFRGLAASVVSSLARMMGQMVAQIVVAKLLKAAMGGFAGGGVVPGGAGGGAGFAGGGLIKGPGGPKSDSIPARVSPGEYIVQSDAVSRFGVANLEAINRGLKIPSLERLSLPQFSQGGLVGAGIEGSDSTINLGIGLDEGLILKHLSSKAARNVILNHIANNPKAAAKALSRSA